MSSQQIGVESIFGTGQFTRGLNRYLAGLNQAVAATGTAVAAVNGFGAATVAAIQSILTSAQSTSQAINQVTQAISAANQAAAAAATPAAPTQQQGPSLADQLAQTRLINEEIRDRVALENLITQAQDTQLTALQRIRNANEQDRIAVLRQLRDQEAAQVQLNQARLNAVRNETALPRDTGKDARAELEAELRTQTLIQQALRARIEQERTRRQLLDANLTVLQRERALIEQATQALEQQRRVQEALAISRNAAAQVLRAGGTAVTDQDLGIKQRDPLEDQLRVQKLISEELRAQVRERQAQITLNNAEATAIQKRQAEIEKETLLLERQKREREIALSGGNVAQLEEARRLNVAIQDLGQKQRDGLQDQISLQRILGEEIRDRIQEEQARLILQSRQTSELQKQQAQLQLQAIASRRTQRTGQVQSLAIPGGEQALRNIRSTTVAARDLGAEVRKTTNDMRSMGTATTALAVTVGSLASTAITSAIRGFMNMGRSILETVTFFERLDLSVQFFTARSAKMADDTLTMDQAFAQTREQAEALTYWLQQLAISSPFTTRQVGEIFRTAQAYGLTRQEAELLTPIMLDFAAASGLSSDVLERLALAFGQIRARGKLTGEEIRQIGNSALPIRDILVKELGIANEKFDELVESGALTSDIVLPALIKAMKDFEGAGKRVSFETIGGLVSAFDELREISTATFFRGVLDPLTDEFQKFFKVANQPQVMAFLKLLGQEIGGNFLTAINNAKAGVAELAHQWQTLDPVLKQQILVFGATFAIVIAVTGALGLFYAALTVLTNPVILLATAIAFFVSEYSSGFAVLNAVTGGFVDSVLAMPGAIGRGISSTVRVVGQGVGSIARFFGELKTDMAQFGAETINAFGEGAIGAVNALLPIFNQISSLFTFWLAPGSPPRVAPDIDRYGEATMQEYFDAFAEANPELAFDKVGNVVQPQIKKLGDDVLQQFNELNPEAQVNQYGVVLTRGITAQLNKASKAAYGVGDALASDEALESASNAGIQVSEAYVDGFLKNMRVLIPPMSKELREILDRIGGGRQLSVSGAFAFNNFLSGFANADFGILSDATGVVQSVLQSLVDIGELDEFDMIRQVFGSSQEIAAAIQEFREVGSISEATLNRLGQSAGQAGVFVVDLLRDYQALARATEAEEAAQDELNRITEQYTEILKPLKRELQEINETVALADEEERILSLQRLINNEAVSGRRKQNAAAQIDQILAERRVRNLEDERDVATEAAEENLKARQEEREAQEEQFEILQGRINAQLQQLGLVAQEGALMKSLEEEAAKLREKQKTELELQQEMLRLQGEEIDDNIKAARAKWVLDQADSTELEKQQAVLALQEVAISRRNRLLEAAEFGIPESELTKLRDMVVTLDDIGEKTKDKLDFESDLSALNDGLVDTKSITEQIAAATAEVRNRWRETKEEIAATMVEINNSLPSFLEFLPDEEGGQIPLVNTLTQFAKGLGLLAGIIVGRKVVSLIMGLYSAFRWLFAVLAGGSAAAGAAGGAGAAAAGGAAGAAAGVGTLTTAIVTLGAAALVTYGYVKALQAAIGLFSRSQEDQFALNTDTIDESLGDFGPALAQTTAGLIETLGPSTEDARNRLSENIVTAATLAIQDGLGNEHVAASIANAVNRSIAEGLIADTPENRAAIAAFQTNLLAVLETNPVGGPINVMAGAEITATPDAAAAEKARTDLGTFLSGIVDEKQKSTFATSVQSLVTDAVALGMTDAQIDTLVFAAFNEGVSAGLVADTPENKKAVATYVDTLVAELQSAAEIESPSKLAEREVGVPFGQGILAGVMAALNGNGKTTGITSAMAVVLTKTTTTSDKLAKQLEADFGAARSDVIEHVTQMKNISLLRFATFSSALTTGSGTLKDNVLASFILMRSGIVTDMGTIKDTIVKGFTLARTAAETEVSTMRTNIIDMFTGEDESILADLKTLFIGPDQIVAKSIGQSFVEGIGLGILAGKENLATAMTSAFSYALTTAGAGFGGGGTAMATVPTQSRSSALMPSNVSSTVRTNNFYLNVQTAAQSQGVVNDFGIMQTMAGT